MHSGISGPLPFLAPFNRGLPEMFAVLDDVDFLGPAEVKRARDEYQTLRSVLSDRTTFEAAFPGVGVQPIQGEGLSHNVIRTHSGIRFSDFEDVTLGPVEWDLAMMGQDTVAQYDIAAVERGLRRTDPQMQGVMDAARRLQFVACLTLIPQLPLMVEGLKSVLDEWCATPLML